MGAVRDDFTRATATPASSISAVGAPSGWTITTSWGAPAVAGEVGARLFPEPLGAVAVAPSDPPAPPILHLTSPYMRGEEVRKVQEALNTNGFANSRDGVYGPFTEALVKRLQDSKGLRADGVVGPAARAALGL